MGKEREGMITMNDKDYIISSDNIFADLGFSDSEALLMQADLLCDIVIEISRRRLTRRQAASLLGISQTDVTKLLEARLSRFSLERLQQMRAKLGLEVAISCQPAISEQGHVTIKLPQTA
jgi:predicted XRE-type DNA-binding protein